jgi:hypothetical protein
VSSAPAGIAESGTVKSQVKSGFRLAGNVVLTIATAGLLVVGVGDVFFPIGVRPESFSTGSQAFGWLYLIVATIIMIWKMDRWVIILPGILGYAALGGILATVSGRLPNNPPTPIPRTNAALITVLLLANSAVSSTFGKRSLNIIDRIALLIFVFSAAFAQSPRHSTMFLALGVGLASLLCAWVYHRIGDSRA